MFFYRKLIMKFESYREISLDKIVIKDRKFDRLLKLYLNIGAIQISLLNNKILISRMSIA